MNPFVSWAIVLTCFALGYVALRGVPAPVSQTFSAARTSSESVVKSTKCKAQADKRPKNPPLPRLPSTQESQVPAKSSARESSLTNGRDTLSKKKSTEKKAAGTKKATTFSLTSDSSTPVKKDTDSVKANDDNPVYIVMNGRPRKLSTPIGMQPRTFTQRADAEESASGSDDEDVVESAKDETRPLAESKWRAKQVSHATDDMNPSFARQSAPARTLKIISSSTNGNERDKPKVAQKHKEEQMTKKQRQNAAKKAKAKADKVEAEDRQAAALKAHLRGLEAQRMDEFVRKEAKTSNAKHVQASAWDQGDWQTVSKTKKVTATNNQEGNEAMNQLIWD